MTSRGEATLGVRTMRGDFERALVAEVLKHLQVAGVHEMAAPQGLHRIRTVEDARALQARLRKAVE